MKIIPSFILSAALTFGLAGCQTKGPSARIEEKAALFAGLTAEQQHNIKAGVIELGYTTDMVYLSLGQPSAKRSKATPDGPVEMWTYHNYFPTAASGTVPANDREEFRANFTPGKDYVPRGVAHGDNQPAISGTTGGPQFNLSLPELKSDTLYVFFFAGKVFQMKLARADS